MPDDSNRDVSPLADVDVRRLAVVDAVAYRAMMLEGYGLHPEAFTASVGERAVLPPEWWAARLAGADDSHERVFGAWRAGRLVGAAGLRFEQRPKTRHKAVLFGMYVRAGDARRGIGRCLVGAVLDEARARRGVWIVQLTVTAGADAAQRLYARCGFAPFGVEPHAISVDDGYADKVHMWADLRTAGRR